MQPAIKVDGTKYWEYILCYVDNVLVISREPDKIMEHLKSHYTLKKGSVHELDVYLGAEIKKWNIPGSDNPLKMRCHYAIWFVQHNCPGEQRVCHRVNHMRYPNLRG
jgi:hypothetical protein